MSAPESRSPERSAAPTDRAPDPDLDPRRIGLRERFGAFYAFYVGLFALLFAYLITVLIAETLLDRAFQQRVDRAIGVEGARPSAAAEIADRVEAAVHDSAWVRWGGLEVTVLVVAQDGRTWLHADGFGRDLPREARMPDRLPGDGPGDWMDLLPATAHVRARLPHNSLVSNGVLIVYSTILMVVVYVANRRLARRETERLEDALDGRNLAARRAAEVAEELAATRARLSQVEPIEREQSAEIEALRVEREALEDRLGRLAQREEELRGRADQAIALADEVRALEDLLEEVSQDLETRDRAIDDLEQDLAKASRHVGRTRSKESQRIARRFRTLYKAIEVDDRAIEDVASLGDEGLKLKAEEAIKRLADEADNVAVRRKVGGLPDTLDVFELGFAGKGRIYYTRGRNRRFRILLVGAKNSQSTDLEYLRRLDRDGGGARGRTS